MGVVVFVDLGSEPIRGSARRGRRNSTAAAGVGTWKAYSVSVSMSV